MNLTECIKRIRENPDPETMKDFSDSVHDMSSRNAPVYTSVKISDTGYIIYSSENSGCFYSAAYTEPSLMPKKEGFRGSKIGFSDFIDCVFSNPHIYGLVFNPDTDPVFVQRKDLQLMTGKTDPRLLTRNWGNGIPAYKESDKMVAEEAMELAMEYVASNGLAKEGYSVLEARNGITVFPNYVAEKDGSLYYIAVSVAVAPSMPRIIPDVISRYIEISKENDACLLYAPVSISSADKERMEKGLLLTGDEYLVNFPGFLELK